MSEAGAHQCHSPSLPAAEWVGAPAVAVLLREPEPDTILAPVGGEACWASLVEDFDSFLDGLADVCFGCLQCLGQFVGPLERSGWLQQVPKWEHGCGHGEGVRDLIHQTEPCSHVGDVGRGGELTDGICEVVGWSHLCWGDCESREFDSVLCKPELGGIKNDPIPGAQVQPFRCLVECLFRVSGP